MYNPSEIKEQITGLEICDLLGLERKVSGHTVFIRCPDHDDRHIGSCKITPYGYTCYACGNYGSVIDLYAKKKGVSISKTINDLGSLLSCKSYDTIERVSLSISECSALGINKSNSMLVKLWRENRQAYDFVLKNLINERILRLKKLKESLSRTSSEFLKLNILDDEILYKLKCLVDEHLLILEGMMADGPEENRKDEGSV